MLKWIESTLATGHARCDPERTSTETEEGDRICRERQKSVQQQIEALRFEISNLVDAIGQGALKSSPALAARLVQAESRLAAQERTVGICRRLQPNYARGSSRTWANFLERISVQFQEDARQVRSVLRNLLEEKSNSCDGRLSEVRFAVWSGQHYFTDPRLDPLQHDANFGCRDLRPLSVRNSEWLPQERGLEPPKPFDN